MFVIETYVMAHGWIPYGYRDTEDEAYDLLESLEKKGGSGRVRKVAPKEDND